MLIQPGGRCATQLFHVGCWHHVVVRIKETSDDDRKLHSPLRNLNWAKYWAKTCLDIAAVQNWQKQNSKEYCMQTKQPHHNSNSMPTHETRAKDTIQNFQFCSVRFRTYSSNISFIWSTLCRVTGTPVSGSWDCTTLRAKPHVSLAQPGITRAQTYCATLAQPTNTHV